ncbi:MAG TPA: dolichyl-phosphate beta-glucosyltransferase [Anaerolineales bacterium]|nr:dolichyl-phosphate beta-glucosyltransferase [Anaerolineales bacterium]
MSDPFLSLIIPAHNEEARLPGTLQQVLDFLSTQPYQSEVLVVENASHDRTLQVAEEFAQRYPWLRVLQCPQRGKGFAVRQGMLAARGEYRFMCDADLAMPASEIGRFLPAPLTGVDIAIASREAPGAIRYHEPLYRHMIGRAYNFLTRLWLLPGLQDTQCGYKCFRGAVVDELFSRQTLGGWSFDVEILFIARRRGLRIVEVPISWTYIPGSKVSVIKSSLRVIVELLTIRLNGWRGVYERPL